MAPFMCYVTTQRGEGGNEGEQLNTVRSVAGGGGGLEKDWTLGGGG